MIGAPGSGKSTYCKSLVEKDSNLIRVCPDDNRAKIGKGEDDQSVSAAAFGMAKSQVRNALSIGKDVVFDATNMYRKTRKDFITIAREQGAEVHAFVFEQTKKVLLERNAKRGSEGGRVVPEDVIDRMLGRYERPDEKEFDKVTFISKL